MVNFLLQATEEGEIYYYVSDRGYVDYANDTRWVSDIHRYNSGNYFQTQEEAEES